MNRQQRIAADDVNWSMFPVDGAVEVLARYFRSTLKQRGPLGEAKYTANVA